MRILPLPIAVAVILLAGAHARAQTWGGLGGNGNWSNADNWNAAITSSGSTALVFNNASNTATILDALVPKTDINSTGTPALEIRSLTFGTLAGPFTVTPGSGAPAIRLIGVTGAFAGISNQSANAQTVNATLTTNSTGGVSVSNTGTGLLTLNGPIQLGGTGFSFTGTGDVAVNGVISGGSNGVRYDGTGTVTLSVMNTYGGTTFIGSTGTVKLAGGDNRLPSGQAVQFNAAGRIDLNGQNQQVSRILLSGTGGVNSRVVNTAAGAAPTFTVALTGGGQSYAGTYGGTGGDNFNLRLTTAAPTNLTYSLNAAHTYTGTTTVQSGTLSLFGSGSLAGSSSIVVGLASGSGAIFDTVDLTGGLSYDPASAGFALASGQTLAGHSRVTGDTLVRAGSVIQGGIGTDIGTLTVSGVVRIQGGTAATGGTLRVAVRDTAGTVTNSSLTVGGLGNALDLTGIATGTSKVRIELRNAGGLQLGTSYTRTVATATAIRRNGSPVGGSFTFNAGDYLLESPDFTGFADVSLRTSTDGTQLILTFTPVPEPATVLGVAALGWLAIRATRRRLTASS